MSYLQKVLQLDDLDRLILVLAYKRIAESQEKRVSGSAIRNDLRINPAFIPGRLRRLVSLGLLEKIAADSSARTKVYGSTRTGHRIWKELMSDAATVT
jgi:DNA-binding MarR family transcriptional regulator